MTTISLEELLNAPVLPSNLPKFEIIKECEKVPEEDFSSSNDESESSYSSSESEIEEVFPCDCGFDEHSNNFEGQACGPTANCINRELFIECNEEECPCRERCQNRRFQKRQYAKVKVIETPGKGFGLFTCEDLKPGTLVMEYVGEIVNQDQMNERARKYSAQGQPHFYFMTLRPNQIIDATCKGNLSRFLNHSCAPNCETQKWIVGGRIKIGLFTLKTIKAGSELTFDYKFVRFGKEPQKCLCGEANCTGFIGVSQKAETEKVTRTKKKTAELEAEAETEDEFEVYMEKEPKSAELPSEISLIVTKLIQTDDAEIMKKLLKILESTEKSLCKRKFLNLHGLKLLATLFTEHLKDKEIVSSILIILKGLPLGTRNLIEDSGWFEKLKLVGPEFEEIAKELEDKWNSLEMAFKIPKKSETRDHNGSGAGSGQATPNPSTSVLMSVPSEFSSALKRKRQWSLEDEPKVENTVKREGNPRDDRDSKSLSRSRSPVKKIPDPMWLSAKAPDGKIYYYHSVTRETSWEVPMIEVKERNERGVERERESERGYDRGYYDRDRGRDRDSRSSDKYSNDRRQVDRYNSHSNRDYSRDNRNRGYHTNNRDSNRDRDRDYNRDHTLDRNSNRSFTPSNSAFLEGVGNSNQLVAIIERAKARRTQLEDGEVDSIAIDLNTQTINGGDFSSPFFMASPVDSKSSNNSAVDKKYYAKLKEEISGVVIRFFSHYRQELGEEFKELARKYTHKIIEKEVADFSSSSASTAELTSKKKQKIKAYLAEVIKGRRIKLLPEHEY